MFGLGVVGSGVARVLTEKSRQISRAVGRPVTLESVVVRDPSKPRTVELPSGVVSADPADILDNSNVDIVVEVMGGQDPALEYIDRAISAGKHVVTANKEVLARHGPEIMAAARARGVQVMFEASVGGGTPIIAPLLLDLVANDVLAINGIINGTTNYILTRMAGESVEFDLALEEAQEQGFAEADPSSDVEGTDAAYKLAILSTLAFGTDVRDTDVYREGITGLQARDFTYAADLGYTIKLLAMARKLDGELQVRVHPVFVPSNATIAKVDGVLNAVEIETDLAGHVLFHGRGAGSLPTTSAVVADIVEVGRVMGGRGSFDATSRLGGGVALKPMEELETKYYLRITVADGPGVLAQIATVFGDLRISIDSVIQKAADVESQTAELVFTTHEANEAAMQKALELVTGLYVVREIGSMVRIEEMEE